MCRECARTCTSGGAAGNGGAGSGGSGGLARTQAAAAGGACASRSSARDIGRLLDVGDPRFVRVRVLTVGPLACNCVLVSTCCGCGFTCGKAGSAASRSSSSGDSAAGKGKRCRRPTLVVDPGGDSRRVLDAIERDGLDVQALIVTHGHLDHFYGAGLLQHQLRTRCSQGASPDPCGCDASGTDSGADSGAGSADDSSSGSDMNGGGGGGAGAGGGASLCDRAAGCVKASSETPRILLGAADAWLWRAWPAQCAMMGLAGGDALKLPDGPDGVLEDGEVVALASDGDARGHVEAEMVHTPGHTPGSMCVWFPSLGLVCSGDTLFCGSIGRTDLPGGDSVAIIRSIRTRLLPLMHPVPSAEAGVGQASSGHGGNGATSAEVQVVPGHGAFTTLQRERATNPFLTHALAARL